MTIDQAIQLGIAVILLVTLPPILLQVCMQRRLLKAQLLYNQFEMYVKANVPVSDKQIEELKLYPKDHMNVEVYEKQYKGYDKEIHKYIYMSDLYEYLAFSHAMPRAKILSRKSLKMWTSDLCEEKEFREVHRYYREYYPVFAKVVRKLLKAKGLDQDYSGAKVWGNAEAKSTA